MKFTPNTWSNPPSLRIGSAGNSSIIPPSTYRCPSTSTDSMNTGSAIAIRTSRPTVSPGVDALPK